MTTSAPDKSGLDIRVRIGITVLLFLIAAWWLYINAKNLGTPAGAQDANGNVLDEFTSAKDILLVVLPLLTSALGYWFGAAGKDQAEQKAEQSRSQLSAVIDELEPGVL